MIIKKIVGLFDLDMTQGGGEGQTDKQTSTHAYGH